MLMKTPEQNSGDSSVKSVPVLSPTECVEVLSGELRRGFCEVCVRDGVLCYTETEYDKDSRSCWEILVCRACIVKK